VSEAWVVFSPIEGNEKMVVWGLMLGLGMMKSLIARK